MKLSKITNELLPILILFFVVSGCKFMPEINDQWDISEKQGGRQSSSSDGEYVMFKRTRILDEMGFDKPVEAISVLMPEDWKVSGGVTWKGINECRADIVQQDLKFTSADGQIEINSYPSKSFVYSDNESLMELLRVGENSGGCEVGQPFDAADHIRKFAASELNAQVSDVKTDSEKESFFAKANEKNNSANGPVNITTSFVDGKLSFDDGRKGVAYVGVTQMASRQPDYFSGGTTTSTTSSVFYNLVIKFPPDREEEAMKIAGMIIAGSRINPVWNQAKSDFLTKLGNMEHASRMERIRLVGEQSKAYARSRDQAMDEQMRSWERQQSSSDASHRQFVRTIREVDTWKSNSGDQVDLSSGYKYGWSKPDGSYILTDNPDFDPAIKLNQNWEKMQKVND